MQAIARRGDTAFNVLLTVKVRTAHDDLLYFMYSLNRGHHQLTHISISAVVDYSLIINLLKP